MTPALALVTTPAATLVTTPAAPLATTPEGSVRPRSSAAATSAGLGAE